VGAFLNHWWNLPFLVMLGLVGVFFLLQVVGMFGDHDADADADADADHDVDADADGDANADADHDADADALGWHDVLAFFGIGRVPFMVVWVALFLSMSFSGILLNSVFYQRGYAGWHFLVVLAASLVIGLVAVAVFARIAARFVDVSGRGAQAKHALAGRVGVVASATCDSRFGEIRVRDDQGNEQLVHGRLADGDPPLAREAKVVLIDFDHEKELFWVAASPDLDDSGTRTRKDGT
jgi:Inner membrane protein YqiJ, N-terminal